MQEGTGTGIAAVVLDVGGVFFVPDTEWLAACLSGEGVPFQPSALPIAHYWGIGAVDEAAGRGEPLRGVYLRGCLEALGVVDEEAVSVAVSCLEPGWRRGSSAVWTKPVDGSVEGLRKLSATGTPLAVVSNSDGQVEQMLRERHICQVGEGRGVRVAAVVDSGVVGVSKPDPAIFAPALVALGSVPEETLYVGDSVHYDVGGATAARMAVRHFDPYSRCGDEGHEHVASLDEVISLVAG